MNPRAQSAEYSGRDRLDHLRSLYSRQFYIDDVRTLWVSNHKRSRNISSDPMETAHIPHTTGAALDYSKIWILRNQPLETQCWILAQFLSSC